MGSTLTFSGSSLSLMRSGEEGTIQRISSPFVQELQQLGIYPGMEVKVIYSHSSVVLQSGNTYFRLDPFQTRAIYVRLSNPVCVYPNPLQPLRRSPHVNFNWFNSWRSRLDPSICSEH